MNKTINNNTVETLENEIKRLITLNDKIKNLETIKNNKKIMNILHNTIIKIKQGGKK